MVYTAHETLQAFLAYLLHIFQGRSLYLENSPDCGRVGDPTKVECIWDCTWVDNPWYGNPPTTGVPALDSLIQASGLRYSIIRYPQDITCLQDCTFLELFQANADSPVDLVNLVNSTIAQRSNIDSIIIEACLIYLELGVTPDCFSLVLIGRRRRGRLVGNSISNQYRENLEMTLGQYPWACSLRTTGYRGKHVCGASLLSTPPQATVVVGAAHCNYLCKDTTGLVVETCCCRDPKDNFASCRLTSSYCGTDPLLRLASPGDLLLVSGEWNIGEEPEIWSREKEVVMPITKIIQHPSYTPENGPGEGWDIAVYNVDDTNLRTQWGAGVAPACLPEKSITEVGTKGIFVAWKDPSPLFIEWNRQVTKTLERYRTTNLLLAHTRTDVVDCRDPSWMASNTFYPRATFCGLDPSTGSCLDTGDSGSGLVAARGDGSYAWLGPLSFYRGCDRAISLSIEQIDLQISSAHGENPGVFSSGLCYLPWIARQFGLKSRHSESSECSKTRGSRQDKDKTDCTTFTGDKCDFNSNIPIADFYKNFNSNFGFDIDDNRGLVFDRCILRALEGYTSLVFNCAVNATTLAVCPNSCQGVSPSSIVAGGSVLLAGAIVSSASVLQAALGLSAVTAAGLASLAIGARDSCSGPLYCRARTGECCLVIGSRRGLVCPRSCS